MQKHQYLATFPAGCYEIIIKSLKSFSLDDFTIIEHDDSSVTFRSPFRVEKLIELRFFTNIYLVVDDILNLPYTFLKGDYFRLMLLVDGAPQVLGTVQRAKIEERIAKKLDLKANTHLSLNDFYLIKRSGNEEFLGLRLSRAKFKRDDLQAGELRPELAHILCLAAGVKAKDTVLDMFAGYGSIPLEAARGFGCKRVLAVDKQVLPGRHVHSAITWHAADASKLNFIFSGSIARIVTDPPWGSYDANNNQNLKMQYDDFTKEMARTLKPGGIAVILTSWSDAEEYLTKYLKLVAKWNILVSGKKATVFKLQKA